MQLQIITILMILLFAPFLTLVSGAGHIATKDPRLDYSNAGFIERITVPFQLQTGILATEFAQLVFPYSIHESVITSDPRVPSGFQLPTGLQLSWQSYASCGSTGTVNPVNIFVENILSTSYYLQFLSTQNVTVALAAGTWYVLTINIQSSTVLGRQRSNQPFYFGMSTLSSTLRNPVVYDENPSLIFLQMLTTPPSTLSVEVAFADEFTKANVGLSQDVFFDIATSIGIDNQAKIELYFQSDDFRFTGICVSTERQAPPAIAALPTSDYNCTVVSPRKIILEHRKGFAANFRVRIRTRVQNPTYVVSSATVQVRTYLSIQPIVIEQRSISAFSTIPIALDQHQFNMLWDISAASSSFFPMQIRAIRGDSATPGYYPYNNFIIHFSPKSSLPQGQEFSVNVNLRGETNDEILVGTINHNLPALAGRRVNCTVVNADAPTTTRRLACSGVGQLQAGVDYVVGLKMYLPYNVDTELIDIDTQNFGSIFIQTFNPRTNAAHTLSIVETSSPKNVQKVKTQNNKNWSPTSLNGGVPISTSTTTSLSNSDRRGVEYTTANDRRLFFAFKAPLSDVTNTATDSAITNSAGIWITMNPGMTFQTSVLRNGLNEQVDQLTTTINTRTSSPTHTSIKISASNSCGLDELFSNTDKFVMINNFKNIVYMSPYADSSVYDFYIVSVEGIEGAPNSQVIRSWVLINAFLLTVSAPTSFGAGISNFWAGASTRLTGETVPAIVRVFGKFTADENNNVKALAVFFDNLEFIEDQFSVNNRRNVSCSSSDKKLTCDGAQHKNSNANFATMSWSQFDFDSRIVDFSVVFPVRTVANTFPKNLYVATLQSGSFGADSPFLRILQIKRVPIQAFSAGGTIALPYNLASTYSGISYDVVATCSGCKPGQIQDLTVRAENTPSVSINAGDSVSAGFTFVSDFDFKGSGSTISFSLSSSAHPCLNFTYVYRPTVTTQNLKFGVFCPIVSGAQSSGSPLTLAKFILPFREGRVISAHGAVSQNTGILQTLQKQTTAISFTNAITEVSVLPAKLGKGVTKARLDFAFTTVNPIINGNTILITFTANVNFVSSSVAYCSLSPVGVPAIAHSCAINVVDSKNIKYVITTTQDFPAGKFVLYHYEVDNRNSDGTDTTYVMYIYSKDGSSLQANDLLAEQASSPGANFQYLNTGVSLPSLSVNYAFTTTNKKAQTIGDFTFTLNNRGFYSQEKLLFNLGGVASDNAGNPNVNCIILTAQKAVSTEFALLSYDDLSRVEIQPKADITSANSFILRCFNILVPFSDNPFDLNAQLVSSSNNLVLFQANAVPYTGLQRDASLGADEVRITSKTFNTAGSRNNITFSMKSSNVDIIATSRIKIVFPVYYQAGINPDGKIYCRLNNQNTQCSITGQRTIELTNSPVNIPRGTSFSVSIQGPVASISTSVYNFFIAIDDDNIETTYTDFGLVSDLSTGGGFLPQINNLLVYNITYSLLETRSKSTISFLFYLPQSAGQLTVGRVIAIDFPALWGNVLEFSDSVCEIYQQGDTIKNYASGCTATGSRLIISIADTLQVASYYFIVLQNVANPENAGCNDYDFIISVPDLGQTQVVLRSFSNLVNNRVPAYIDNVVKPRLYFSTSDSSSGEFSSLEVTPGVYSQEFYIKAAGQATFSVGFAVKLESEIFFIKEGYGSALVGESSAPLRIYCPQSTLGGEYYLFITKEGDSGAYINLPLFKIVVKVSPIAISLPVSDITVPSGSAFFPIYASLNGNFPISDVTIKFVAKEESGISFLNNFDTLTLTYDNPEGLVQLTTNTSLAMPTNKTTIDVILAGTNKNSFTLARKIITVTISDPLTSAPNMTLSATGVSSFATRFDISLSCDQESIIYYQLAFDYCQLSTVNDVIANGKAQVRYSRDDYCQNQYGQVSIYSKGVGRQITLRNLLSNKTYAIQGVCVNPFNNVSSVQTGKFSTKDNGGKTVRLNILFDAPLIFIHKQRVACFLASHFQAPARYVISSEGVFCSQFASRLLQSNSTNNTTPVDTTNTSAIQNITLPENLVSYFILNLDERESDNLFRNVIADTNKRQFSSWIRGNISGLPNITSLTPAYAINITASPVLYNSSLKVEGRYSFITLKNLRLNESGYIYALAYPRLPNEIPPNPDQIRKGLYANNTEINRSLCARGWAYSYQGGFVNVNITPLPHNTSYSVYYVGSNENPGNRTIFTSVYSFNYSLELNRSAVAALQILKAWEVLALLVFLMGVFLLN